MAKAKDIDALFIRTRHDGTYRRAGFQFNRQGMGIALDALDKQQIKLLKNDPHLDVQECTFPADEGADQAAAAAKQAEADKAAAEAKAAKQAEADKAAAEAEAAKQAEADKAAAEAEATKQAEADKAAAEAEAAKQAEADKAGTKKGAGK